MTSAQFKARVAGVFYLLTIVTGSVAAAVGKLVVIGDIANVVAAACYVVVTLLFYQLFKPVNKTVSLIAAFFSLLGVAVGAANMFHKLPFSIDSLVFFGCYCLLIGYLILKSTFLPGILGLLMMFAGLGWLTFLAPAVATHLSPYIVLPGLIGEGSLTVWLLVKGVNIDRWNEQAMPGVEVT